jgi:hypothetical protein
MGYDKPTWASSSITGSRARPSPTTQRPATGRKPPQSSPRRDFAVSDRLSPTMPHRRILAIATLLMGRARADGRPGAHAPAEADRAAMRTGDARGLPPAPAGNDRQASPASWHGVQGRDARELSLVEGGAGDQAQALADGVGCPRPARDQGWNDLGARDRPCWAAIAGDPARRAAGAPGAPGAHRRPPGAVRRQRDVDLAAAEERGRGRRCDRGAGARCRHRDRVRQELRRPGRGVAAV